MGYKLKDIDVQFISLVKAGANRRQIIWKSSDDAPVWERRVAFAKSNDEQRIVYGVVYAPDEDDTHGDSAVAKEIRKAAELFMRKCRTGEGVDHNHSFQGTDGAFVAESWIIEKGDPRFPTETPGAWAVGIKIDDDLLWERVKNGEIGGLSMGGTATKIQKSEDGGAGIFAALRRLIKQYDKVDEMTEAEVKALIAKSVISKEDVEAVVKAAVQGVFEGFDERVKKIEKSTAGTGQGEKSTDDDKVDYTAIGERIAKSVTGGGK